jgi:hypothetical protein
MTQGRNLARQTDFFHALLEAALKLVSALARFARIELCVRL